MRQAYAAQSALADLLLRELTELFSSRRSDWYYTSRKKAQESFYQKLESGRFSDPERLEDFVGTMIVVPTLADIPIALAYIDDFFQVVDRRPPTSDVTSKQASDFRFDDLRLYGHLKPAEELPPRPIDEIVFEIQIKTFLQHAWSIATHDLVYKYDRASWARSRVAFQIKALLEHADLSVSSMNALEDSPHLPSIGEPESRLDEVIRYLKAEWTADVLATDLRRQGENFSKVARTLDLKDFAQLTAFIERGKADGGGRHPDGLSPYQTLVWYASILSKDKLLSVLRRRNQTYKIYITPEVLVRLGADIESLPNALL
ncbi:hypothetical protein IN07_14370 [Modestobacter caceresii]|uniref:RelA/SpoT domain-containing protein n=2 Tax=Modestobacter caceresii TaxID=1522368 RepID=A0A098Y6B2_9ACTN|nr:hypothetical protein IN07_14370 [Modestobacter caceresii]